MARPLPVLWLALIVLAVAGCWRGSPPSPPAPPAEEAPRPDPPLEPPPTGGVITTRGEHDEARARAEEQMRDHCGSRQFVVTQETSETRGVVTSGSGIVYMLVWHFHYQCGPAR